MAGGRRCIIKRENMRLLPLAQLAALSSLSACIPATQQQGQNAGWPRYANEAVGSGQGAKLEVDPGIFAETPRPSWDGGRVVAAPGVVEEGFYVVGPGDTLRGIGNKTGAGSEAIAAANGLSAPYNVYVGQRLTIPGGRYHTVQAGETGIAIAQAYRVRWMDVVALNGLEEPFVLRIGQRLRLPSDAGGGSGVSAARAATPAPNIPSAPSLNGAPANNGDPMRSRAAAFDIDINDVVSGSQPALAPGVAPVAPVPKATAATGGRKGLPMNATLATPATFGGTFQWPVKGALSGRFGSMGGGKINEGIDIAAAMGAPVLASARGVVVYSGDEIGVLGGLVLIDHGGGWVSAYGRLSRYNVVRGDSVAAGQVIGAVGDTGYGSGPALHFQLRRDLEPVDPIIHLPKR
jgi:murein DD-endopeptidase MepM/ murein hydrolase activator NlpD